MPPPARFTKIPIPASGPWNSMSNIPGESEGKRSLFRDSVAAVFTVSAMTRQGCSGTDKERRFPPPFLGRASTVARWCNAM